jgi:hypothetical protein
VKRYFKRVNPFMSFNNWNREFVEDLKKDFVGNNKDKTLFLIRVIDLSR